MQERQLVADLVGGVLLLLFGAWLLVSSAANRGSRPGPVLALLGGSALALVAGRWLAHREAGSASRVMAIGVAGSLALSAPGLLRAGGAPLGYANANATLAALGALAAVDVAAATRPRRRAPWVVLAAALGIAVVVTGSVLGAGALGVGVLLLLTSALTHRSDAAVHGGALAVVLALGITASIGQGADPAGLGERAAERGELWVAAVDIVWEHPMIGIGPGGFALANPVSADADLAWAHHDYLQLAAEAGLVGLLLFLALLGWAYRRLALAAGNDPERAAVAAAGLTVVALHASVDHVLGHAAVVVTLAVLVGAATAHGPHQDRGSPD